MQPRVEAEVALVLERDLTLEQPTVADVIMATAYAVPSIEVVGSRIANWDIKIQDTIADNASGALFVLGGPPRRLEGLDLRLCGMVMERRGEQISIGAGAACLGNPLNAAAWLARKMVEVGMPLQRRRRHHDGRAGPDGAGRTRRRRRSEDFGARLGPGRLSGKGLRQSGKASQSRDHRLGQYRHRPDDQDQAPLEDARDGGDGRHRSEVRRPGARRAHGRRDDARGHRRLRQDAGVPGHRARVRRDLGGRAQAARRGAAQARQADHRPDAGGDRPLHRAGRQYRRAISTRPTSTW